MKKIITMTMVLVLAGCSSTPSVVKRMNEVDEYTKERIEDSIDDVPDWFMEPPENHANVVFVTGTGLSNSMTMARNKAMLDAQVQLADQVHALVSSHTKQRNLEANGDGAINMDQVVKKLVAEANLAGYSVEKKELMRDGRKYRFYVLLAYPVGESNLMLTDQRNQSMLNQTLKSNDERFIELDKEIAEQKE